MNAKTPQFQHKPKGDLFILINKQHLPKLQQFSSLYKRKKSTIPTNPQIAHNNIKAKSEKNLSQDMLPAGNNKIKNKLIRKESQVSIVDDFIDISKEEKKKIFPSKENQYLISISTCPRIDSLKQVQSHKDDESFSSFSQFQQNQFIELRPEILEKNVHLKAFFQYILDFKLMNKNSYMPHKREGSISKIQQGIKSTSKKLPNSLAVHFPEKQAEKNMTKPQQIKTQIHQNKETRNRQLQNSQTSLVDVRFSSASMQDFSTMFKHQHKRLVQSPSSSMKKSKKVYFDFENPRLTSYEQIQETNPIVQSENNVTIINRTHSRIVSLEQLKKRIQNTEELATFTHHGYFCDQCKVDPIVGKRYRCIQCDQYDLCENCYKKECDKYGKILKQYENSNQPFKNQCLSKSKTDFLFQMKPLLKKEMSDIVEEEILSQNYSSQQNMQFSSNPDFDKGSKDHVHLMQEVHKPKQKHHVNFQKILRQTNRCSMRSINDKNTQKEQQNFIRKNIPLNPNSHRQKLLKSIKMHKSRLTFSQRIIPLRSTQKNHRKIMESKQKQIQNLTKSTQQISNLFK